MHAWTIRLAVRPASLISAGAILAFAAACGGGGGPATTAPGGPATTAPGATGATNAPSATGAPSATAAAGGPCPAGEGLPVVTQDFSFGPQSVTVPVGGAVTWTNTGSAAHTVTFDDGPDCGRFTTGQSVSRTFDAAGTFAYVCTFHPATMRGTVVVQ